MTFHQRRSRRWHSYFHLLFVLLSSMLNAPSLCRSFHMSSLPLSFISMSSLLTLRERTAATNINNNDKEEDVIVSMDTPARESLPCHLQLVPIPGKGLGIVTRVFIRKNTVVGDYKGEVISKKVKDRRYLPSLQHLQLPEDVIWAQSRRQRGQSITGSYLYGVSMPTTTGTGTTRGGGGDDDADPIYIDAEDEYYSTWTRFLNHASSSSSIMGNNNNLNPKSIHESYDGNPRVWFVANRNIQPGEELCFDYGDDYWLPDDQVF